MQFSHCLLGLVIRKIHRKSNVKYFYLQASRILVETWQIQDDRRRRERQRASTFCSTLEWTWCSSASSWGTSSPELCWRSLPRSWCYPDQGVRTRRACTRRWWHEHCWQLWVFPSAGWSEESGRGDWSARQRNAVSDIPDIPTWVTTSRPSAVNRKSCELSNVSSLIIPALLISTWTRRSKKKQSTTTTCKGSARAMTALANSRTEARLVRSRSIISTLELPVDMAISLTAFKPFSLLRHPRMR